MKNQVKLPRKPSQLITLALNDLAKVERSKDYVVMMHELGHCLGNRPHNSNIRSNGRKASIMNPVVVGSREIMQDQEYYKAELMAGAKHKGKKK